MADNNQTVTTLRNLLDYDARKFTSAEIQLQNILPQWIQQAGSLQLKTVLQRYLDLVQQHIKKMEYFFPKRVDLGLLLSQFTDTFSNLKRKGE